MLKIAPSFTCEPDVALGVAALVDAGLARGREDALHAPRFARGSIVARHSSPSS
jgi:hypothetical protein